MGVTLTSFHLYCSAEPSVEGYSFRSFSDGWYTCTCDLSDKVPDYTYKAAAFVSKALMATVLYFAVIDSDDICIALFNSGKLTARFSSDATVSSKSIYSIPEAVGYREGNRRRLSHILACADTELMISMLEEFFGVCLMYDPKLDYSADELRYERDDTVYRKYTEAKSALCGKSAPMEAKLVSKFTGKIFYRAFGANDYSKNAHCFLFGYGTPDSKALKPVRFFGKELCGITEEEFGQGNRIPQLTDARFHMEYGAYKVPNKLTFTAAAPDMWQGRTVPLPDGYRPAGFLSSSELLIYGRNRVAVMDSSMKVIAELKVSGDVADVVDDHILTYIGDSFCGYCYDPKAQVRIYAVVKRQR